jgi:putative ABC transport system permease protein
MSFVPLDGSPARSAQPIMASWRMATPSYFQALRIPLAHGRLFDERHDASGRPILLSEGLAQRLWRDGRDPIGRLVGLGDNPPFTVTGVVGEVRQLALNEDPRPTVYLPTSWYVWETMIVVMRATGEPVQLAPALRRAVARLDQQQPVFALRTLEHLLDAA